MEETNNSFILLSASVPEDTTKAAILLPLNENYTLSCSSYKISRKNVLSYVATFSKQTLCDISSYGKLSIKATGNISFENASDFLSSLNEISERKEPFNLTLGGITYSNMLLKEYTASIDKYEKTAVASVEFCES